MSAERLFYAILSSSYESVLMYLRDGVDPNKCADMKSINWISHNLVAKTTPTMPTTFTHVHAAVLNCFHNPVERRGKDQKAIPILRDLLSHGANAEAKASDFILHNIDITNEPRCPGQQMTPIDLAVYLRRNTGSRLRDEKIKILNSAITLLSRRESVRNSIGLPMAPVAEPVLEMWKSLLLSEGFSDVHFHCEDGTVLHAHRCVLAAASPYFRNYFEGPWGQLSDSEHANGVWNTANSAEVMRSVLAFMYIGKLPERGVLDSDPYSLLSVATEYGLDYLVKLSETSCIRKLDDDNAKDILQLADLHCSPRIKTACFEYIRNNPQVLTRSDMMALAGENKILWRELGEEITPPSKRSAKRARKS